MPLYRDLDGPVSEAAERVTGALPYTLNHELPGMAYGKVLRSPVPHARIRSIDSRAARAVRGVFCVVTGADLERTSMISNRYGRIFRDQTVFASEVVRFVGEPVAGVAAISADVAAEACNLIEVDYEELPAVFTPSEALVKDAPLVHRIRPSVQPEFEGVVAAPPEPSNIASHFKQRHGDVAAGFASADQIFEDHFSSPAVQHVALEPHVALATYDKQHLTIWSATQMPHSVRAQMATMVGLPIASVRVIVSNLGGGFGSKASLRVEHFATVLSKFARRPVKVTLSREEEFITVTKHAGDVHIKTGVMDDGRIVARQVTMYFNTGAYADVGPSVARRAGSCGIGPYRIPNVRVDSYAVYTNTVPAGAFRGFGVSQFAWAYESQMDIIANSLAIEPAEIRRRNVVRDGDIFCTGEQLHEMHYGKLLEETISGLDRLGEGGDGPKNRSCGGDHLRRGRGIALAIKATATPSTSTASAKLNSDGSLNVLTSSVEMGQGARTVLAQMAAEVLGVKSEQVKVSYPDTELTPYDQQTSSSRTTFSMGRAVVRAIEEIRVQLLNLAAELMGSKVEHLELRDGQVCLSGGGSVMSYGELLSAGRCGNLLGSGTFMTLGDLDLHTGQGIGSVHWETGATGVEVEVDCDTGRIRVVSASSTAYSGRVVNRILSELQLEGCIAFGLGQALFEELRIETGQVANANLSDYMIPSLLDYPESVHVAFIEDVDGEIHGLGEIALPTVMAAVGNAVFDATGVRIRNLPISPERVLRGLELQKGRQVPSGE